jgi:hypothetical protein
MSGAVARFLYGRLVSAVTSAECYEAGMPLGLIHATSRARLKD